MSAEHVYAASLKESSSGDYRAGVEAERAAAVAYIESLTGIDDVSRDWCEAVEFIVKNLKAGMHLEGKDKGKGGSDEMRTPASGP